MRIRFVYIVCVLFVTTSCGVTDSTQPYVLDSLDDRCEGDEELTGQSVLDEIEKDEYTADLEYSERESESTIRVRLSYDGGKITCYPAAGGDFPRGAYVSLAGEIEVKTDDGRFEETTPGELTGTASKAGGIPFEGPGFREKIPLEDLKGSYEPTNDGSIDAEIIVDGFVDAESQESSGELILDGPRGTEQDYLTIAAWGERTN